MWSEELKEEEDKLKGTVNKGNKEMGRMYRQTSWVLLERGRREERKKRKKMEKEETRRTSWMAHRVYICK